MADRSPALIGIDIGTTHCKAGLFVQEGRALRRLAVASRPMKVQHSPGGPAYFDPEEVWQRVTACVRDITEVPEAVSVRGVGVSSMAETGLLVDRQSGAPRSALIPWFDPSATPQAQSLDEGRADLRKERFLKSGLYPNFKCGLAKILWLRAQDVSLMTNAIWLSTADYIAYRLSGRMATDYSLAGRTYAFDINHKGWDAAWLSRFGLSVENFPEVLQAGRSLGGCTAEAAKETGLVEGAPVVIAGHDHVSAAFAAGAAEAGVVFDSMGTAEALVGAFEDRTLGEANFASGLVFGCHVIPQRKYWMGGLSASGGSVEWFRSLWGDSSLTYAEFEALLDKAGPGPTGIVYFPYLSGSGSPHTDVLARGAFVGLSTHHSQSDMAKAILEGTAFEMQVIRQAAEGATGEAIGRMTAAGGGTRSRHWMQIKADVAGCPIEVMAEPEATLLGAALLAGIGSGVFKSYAEAQAAGENGLQQAYHPDISRHRSYKILFERGYQKLQNPLRAFSRETASWRTMDLERDEDHHAAS